MQYQTKAEAVCRLAIQTNNMGGGADMARGYARAAIVYHGSKLTAKQRKEMQRIITRNWERGRYDWRQDISDPLERRERLTWVLDDLSENGKVAIVTEGRDCDHSYWANVSWLVDAHPIKVERWLDRYYENAEGPQSHWITKPSLAPCREQQVHRDLALEAFENGHPHLITV